MPAYLDSTSLTKAAAASQFLMRPSDAFAPHDRGIVVILRTGHVGNLAIRRLGRP